MEPQRKEKQFQWKKKKEQKPYFSHWRMNGKWRNGHDDYSLSFLETSLRKKAWKQSSKQLEIPD